MVMMSPFWLGMPCLTYAFEHVAAQTQGATPERILRVIAGMAKAVGGEGLVGGQVVDLASEGNPDATLETLNFIHTHKTAALLEISVTSGAMLAGASETEIEHLTRYAQRIGLAFQIVDDILDITSTAETLGKSIGKDVQADKATYPRFWGIEESRNRLINWSLKPKRRSRVLGHCGNPCLPLPITSLLAPIEG
jgi:geranylgeranyl diphosphate synthase type II